MSHCSNHDDLTPDGLPRRNPRESSSSRSKIRLIDRWSVIDMLGISESTLERRMVDDELFPRPRRIGTRTIRWIEADVEDYLLNLETVDPFAA